MTPSTPTPTAAGALADRIEKIRKQAFELPPREQHRLAWFIAENVGYVLTEEPPHPDSPHHPDNKTWTPKQYWEYVSGFVSSAWECAQMREMLAERGLYIASNPAPQETRGDEPVAWLDIRTAGLSWQNRIVATNPQFVENNGPEHFAALYATSQQSPRLEREGIAQIIDPNSFTEPKHPAPDDGLWRGQARQSAFTKADTILALLSPDTAVASSPSHREVHTPGVVSNREPIAGPINFIWPAGCQSPNSCHRNGRCMYVGCKHDGKDIRILAQLVPSNRQRPHCIHGLADSRICPECASHPLQDRGQP